MARISDEELSRLKREVSVQRLAEAKGVKLRGHGKDLLGLCPFHDDRQPSLVVTPERNIWHCLGACQAGGSVIEWVMRAEGVSFRHAVELLREQHPSLAAPILAPRGRPAADGQQRKAAKHSTTGKLEELADGEERDEVLMARVVDYYHRTLKDSAEALSYLSQASRRNLLPGPVRAVAFKCLRNSACSVS